MGMSYELSDGLARLRQQFERLQDCGGTRLIGEQEITGMVAQLRAIHALAQRLENEVSASRWNSAARRDRTRNLAADIVSASRPGSNVRIFPVIARPIPEDRP